MRLAIEAWVRSLKNLFAEQSVSAAFSHSEHDQANPSVSVNLSAEGREADLVVWESDQGELILAGPKYSEPLQEHLKELTNLVHLATALSRMISNMA